VAYGKSHIIIAHTSTADNEHTIYTLAGIRTFVIEFRRPHSLEHEIQFLSYSKHTPFFFFSAKTYRLLLAGK
jgi:hypothetical protein